MDQRPTDTSVIPPGIYCYRTVPGSEPPSAANGFQFAMEPCPYWRRVEGHHPQENGYCAFLGRGDWEADHIGLLWDQVKECSVNIDPANPFAL